MITTGFKTSEPEETDIHNNFMPLEISARIGVRAYRKDNNISHCRAATPIAAANYCGEFAFCTKNRL